MAEPRFNLVVDRLAAAGHDLPEEELVVSHGDFSPRNLLQADAGLVLIDFDRVQHASPWRDVGYWTAWLWATAVLGGESPARGWALGETFVAAYRATTGRRPDPRQLAWHQAAALVRITHGWGALRGDAAGRDRMLDGAHALLARAN
ncbi:MAG: phosphotransferase [Nocardioides sp.]